MTYHVPFHMRNENGSEKPPIHIGFEVPSRPKRRFSLIGFGGFMLCLFTCGAMAPFALIMSLIGLRHGPNFFSVAGTILSSLALAGMAVGLVGSTVEEHHRDVRRENFVQAKRIDRQNEKTRSIMIDAEKQFRAYKSENDNKLPSPMSGSLMAVNFKDAWNQELRYETQKDFCILRSAGADREFETSDDLIRKIAGYPVQEYDISMVSDRTSE